MRSRKLIAFISIVGPIFYINQYSLQADTFFGTLVPMTTPVVLTSPVTSLQIGLNTTLTASGGDGTGGYRFNNLSDGFCGITSLGVVNAIFPGRCSFTVTRVATGKYLDTTSNTVVITTVPEPDKSVISSPEPEITPTPTPTPTTSATPTAIPRVSQNNSANTNNLDLDSNPKLMPSVTLRKPIGFQIKYGVENSKPGYILTWKTDSAAKAYSIYLNSDEEKFNLSVTSAAAFVPSVKKSTYKIEARSIDSKGQLSPIFTGSFSIPDPKPVYLRMIVDSKLISLSNSTKKSLENFAKSISISTPVKISVEYQRSDKNSRSETLATTKVMAKYLEDLIPGLRVTPNLILVSGKSSNIEIIGTGLRFSPRIFINR